MHSAASLLWQWLLKFTVSITFLSRGWLYLRWDSPIRGLLWDEQWWSGVLENWMGTSWEVYAAHSDPYITRGIEGVGCFLLAAAVFPWFVGRQKSRWWVTVPIGLAGLILVIDSIACWHEKDFEFGTLLEKSLQCSAPFFLLFLGPLRAIPKIWLQLVAVACSLTFFGHALYALNIHPRPASFATMCMDILGFSEHGATTFLVMVGVLDIVVAIGIFLPGIRTAALGYMVVWGALTALARVVANLSAAENYFGLDPWLAETFVRTAHCTIPLILLTASSFPDGERGVIEPGETLDDQGGTDVG